MPDPYRRVQPGDDFNISAAAWNAAQEAGREARNRQHDRPADDRQQRRDACIIRVKNETGTDLPRCSVVGLDGPIFLPSDDESAALREVTFRGTLPTSDHLGRFAILMEPAPDERVVRAYLAGVCWVRVDVVDEDDGWADVDPNETGHLISSSAGSAQILWKETDEAGYGYGTGEQWAIVRIGGGGVQVRRAEAVGTITGRSGSTPGTGTVAFYGESGFTAGATATIENDYGGEIEDGVFVFAINLGGGWRVLTADCNPDPYA